MDDEIISLPGMIGQLISRLTIRLLFPVEAELGFVLIEIQKRPRGSECPPDQSLANNLILAIHKLPKRRAPVVADGCSHGNLVSIGHELLAAIVGTAQFDHDDRFPPFGNQSARALQLAAAADSNFELRSALCHA